MPRLIRLRFADGRTEESVIADARTTQFRHAGKSFKKTDTEPDDQPPYLEQATADSPGATLPPQKGRDPDRAAPSDEERLVFGPNKPNTTGWW